MTLALIVDGLAILQGVVFGVTLQAQKKQIRVSLSIEVMRHVHRKNVFVAVYVDGQRILLFKFLDASVTRSRYTFKVQSINVLM